MLADQENRLDVLIGHTQINEYHFGEDEKLSLTSLYDMYAHTYSKIPENERIHVLPFDEFLLLLQKYPNILIATNQQTQKSAFILLSKPEILNHTHERFMKIGPIGFSPGVGKIEKASFMKTFRDFMHREEVKALGTSFCAMVSANPGPVPTVLTKLLGFTPNANSTRHKDLMATFVERYGTSTMIDPEFSTDKKIVYREVANIRRPHVIKPYPLQVLLFNHR